MMVMYKELGINTKKSYMITFVGGGGKTSLMFSLANDLKNYGKVLVTTTTKIFLPEKDNYNHLVSLDHTSSEFLRNTKEGITLLGKYINEDNKVVGVEKEVLDNIYESKSYQFILIEADGAKRMPLKASNETEPLIPSKTDINIGIIGFDALDKKVEKVCFREGIFESLTGKSNDDDVDDDCILKLLEHENGMFKGTPKECKRFFIINKCDDEISKKRANILLEKVLYCKNVDRVFFSSVYKKLIKRMYINVCGIVMASGLSRRMGRNKLIMEINGETMIERIVKECNYSHLREVIVVYNKEEVLEKVKDYPIKHVYNGSPETGQSESIKIGIKEAEKLSPKGYMFLVADQPFIKSRVINTLLHNFNRHYHNIVLPIYNEKKGNPVIFPSCLSPKFSLLQGDSGGREIINNYEKINKINIEDASQGLDIDTEEAYESLKDFYTED